MKAGLKKLTVGVLACGLALSFTGCGKTAKEYYDNEDDPLIFSTLEVDKVFNPFYSTSATDSNVVGLTQIGMISNDENGGYTYGENAPTAVVQDLEIKTEGEEPKQGEDDKRLTTYKFVLRNNVKFSDGSPLSIKDVLFNLYVYLDMAYTGSSTIYSTDIVGLKRYRTQEENEKEQDEFMKQFQIAAQARVDALVEAAQDIYTNNGGADFEYADFDYEAYTKDAYDFAAATDTFKNELVKLESRGDVYKNLSKDYVKAKELFAQELEADYSNAMNTYEDFVLTDKDGKEFKNLFSTDVEMFLYNEGQITWNRKDGVLEYGIAKSLVDSYKKLDAEKAKAAAINYIYSVQMGKPASGSGATRVPAGIEDIVTMWATADELNTYLVNDEMEEHFKGATLRFPNISGIKFANGGASRGGEDVATVNGKDYATPTYKEAGKVESGIESGNEVLSIQIHGVDPKAIWNFSFAVAPMYYYSDAEHIEKFDFISNFGVQYNSQTFMNNVIKNPDKIGVPVGAGPYRASRSNGLNNDKDLPSAGEFYDRGSIYFERNNHYIQPVTVKKVRYRVVASNQMLDNLYTHAVDFAEPNAKPEMVKELNKKKKQGFNNVSVTTSGYGYIGINAGKVPDLAVRQAIMYCINTQLCVQYYQTDAQPIYRSMSTSSWAYPEGCTAYYPYIGGRVPQDLTVVDPTYREYVTGLGKKAGDSLTEEEQKTFIELLMDSAGYTQNSKGIYSKGSHVCKYTFTIAGETNDHPAWQALYNAGTRLNGYGFQINVTPDANALKKLSTGDLTVWAAAWGSTIDPDMYQVYHKDSTASSVKNWGYPQILRNAGGRYATENDILTTLAELIERGRSIDGTDKAKVQEERAKIYSLALDEVMKLAVELPTYQRNDLFAYNANKIDESTFTPEEQLSSYKGLTSDLHLVSLIQRTQEQ